MSGRPDRLVGWAELDPEALAMAGLESQLLEMAGKALAAGPAGRQAMAGNPDYLEFRGEVSRLSSPSTTEPPDWGRMEQICLGLAPLSPDLLVYTHICHSVFNTRGYGALAASLKTLEYLIREGWDSCSPAKARGEVFKTLSRRMAANLKARPPERGEVEDLKASEAAAVAVTAALENQGVTGLVELQEGLNAFLATLAPKPAAPPPPPPPPPPAPKAPEPEPEPEADSHESQGESTPEPPPPPPPPAARATPPPPAAAPAAAPSASGGGEPAAAATDADGKSRAALETELRQLVGRLTGVMREEDAADPVPYRLLRVVVWGSARLPVPDKVQKTRLPPPAPHILKRMSAPIAAGTWKEALKEAEDAVRNWPLWLDLQHRIVQCLEGLGATGARDAVVREMLGLLDRLPELVQLKFSTGTPFAAEATVEWIQQVRAKTPSIAPMTAGMIPAMPRASVAPVAAAPAMIQAPMPAVSLTLSSGSGGRDEAPLPEGLMPGLAELQSRQLSTSSARRRFELRLDMATLALAAGRPDLAFPMLAGIAQELDRHQLEQWEPALAANALKLYVVAGRMVGHPDPEKAREHRINLWMRLCQLSPADAAAIGPEL